MTFQQSYAQLNEAQKQAVDTIEGPVLVIAGPGTGKTQLLSLRVANILEKTDTAAKNILCLTFTESGTLNMRERLTRFIGKTAYDVNIATYHTFGSDLIRRFPDYFTDTRMQRPIDELGKHTLLEQIVAGMSYLNPLKQTQHHLGDLIATISEVKRALLSADDLRGIAETNQQFIKHAQPFIAQVMEQFTRMPSKLEVALPFFVPLVEIFASLGQEAEAHPPFHSLAELAKTSLTEALQAAESSGKTKPLTDWKNKWLAKNANNQFILQGELENRRITALADVLESYQAALAEQGMYDFDDMITRAIQVLEQHAELRFSLQEQYLYLLLDEFQDTNAAQLRLVQLLTDNPVHEQRPNVLAVGDDDQAIYAFQGAEYSNMLDFYQMYRNVTVVNLTDNYRSHADILHVAHGVAEQIETRLQHHFEDMSKVLHAANPYLPANAHITRHEFLSDVSEASWIAEQIKALVEKGVAPSEIAVLAPKHRYLEPLVPYLNSQGLPVRYEKRENILEAPVVRQLIRMSQLVLALQKNNQTAASTLWPEVLSYEFWTIPTSAIWQQSWRITDARNPKPGWSQALLENEQLRHVALFFLALANHTETETLETMLDYLTGTTPVETHEPDTPQLYSPLKKFYIDNKQSDDPDTFYHTLSHLSVLRAKLREHQEASEHTLQLADFINFVNMYQAAGQQIINTSPYAQAADAVQLMTVFKAKGLEFAHVFLPSCLDDVWGDSARAQTNKLTLPPNLTPIRHAGGAPDEKLRLFFVAITRARLGLTMTSHLLSFSGKQTKRLKYLDEQEQSDGSFRAAVLPEANQTVQRIEEEALSEQALELSWQSRHLTGIGEQQLKATLAERLQSYQLSPTHLNAFTDLVHCGPQAFFLQTILRFPEAPTVSTQFGNAIHETLEWVQLQLNAQRQLPITETILRQFDVRLAAKHLEQADHIIEQERGHQALRTFFANESSHFAVGDLPEQNFAREGVVMNEARLGGKIDKLRIDKQAKTITVYDYKTGASANRWESTLRMHKFRQQLYSYKLLVENSQSYRGYTVEKGVLAFVEPDTNGHINTLELTFKKDETERTQQLLLAVWRQIQVLEFVNTSAYPASLTGVRQFEEWLLGQLS